MPDCSSTEIRIGGHIATVDAFRDLVDAIIEDGAGVDWSGADEEAVIAQLRETAAAECSAVFNDPECSYGSFDAIEACCRALELPYERGDDGHYAYGSENVAWHPGMDEPLAVRGTLEQGPCIDLESLLRWRREGRLDEKLTEIDAAFTIPPLTIAPDVLAAIEAGALEEEEA